MDSGNVPEQFAVILLLEQSGKFSLPRLRQLIAERILALPRLRQRLVRVPLGCGAPVWVDDPDFEIDRHVRAVSCRPPGDEPALLDTALSVVLTPLPRQAPLWSVTLVTGLAGGAAAVVVVLHHVLADGLGGVNILTALLDPGEPPAADSFPRPWPTRASLVRDAWLRRLRGLGRIAQSWRSLRRTTFAGGGLLPVRALPCSLVQRTSPRRKMAVVTVDRAQLAAVAHRQGASTNDAVLVAIAGALQEVLLTRGESVDRIAVTVPVSGRSLRYGSRVGNLVSPMLVEVPTGGGIGERLAEVGATVRARKALATGPAPIAILGGPFRLIAKLGGYRFYMNHQHRTHTLVTHVRGPAEPGMFGGHKITGAIPVGVGEGGNMTVYFEVLSYAGLLTITAIVDPDHGPELDDLTDRLRNELDSIMAQPSPSIGSSSPS